MKKIALTCQLLHDIEATVIVYQFMSANDIGMLDGLKNLHFRHDAVKQTGVPDEVLLLHILDGALIAVPPRFGEADLTIGARAYHMPDFVHVIDVVNLTERLCHIVLFQ